MPSKRAKLSSANEDFSDDMTIPPGRWDASEELSSFLDVLFTDKPLSVYDQKQIMKEFPRPNVESVFTPVLDDYLASLLLEWKEVPLVIKKLKPQMSSFDENVKKTNETVKIFFKAAPGIQTCSFFEEGPPPNSGQGKGVHVLENGQITHQASQPEGEGHIS